MSIKIVSNNANPNEESEESIFDFIRTETDDEFNHNGEVVFDDPWYDVNLELGTKEEE